MMHSYREYIFGVVTAYDTSNDVAIEENNDIATKSVTFAAVFSLLCFGLPKLIQLFYPKFYQGLSEKKKKELPTYSACLAHHIVVVAWGLPRIYRDWNAFPDCATNVAEGLAFVPYSFGYLFGDTVFLAIQEALAGSPSFLIHHSLSFLLCYGVVVAPRSVTVYIPHILITEISSIFFAFAWFLRGAGYERNTSQLLFWCELLFALSFFAFRIVNLLPVVLVMWATPNCSLLRAVLTLVYCLQLYWFSKILLSLQKKSEKKSGV